MGAEPIRLEVQGRGARMLRTALGGAIAEWLADPAVIEIMLNPDGRLWVDRLGVGIADSGILLSAADGERIIRLVAHHVGAEVHTGAPRVSAELPEGGERFEGLLPPVVAAPTFAIRKPAVAVFMPEADWLGDGETLTYLHSTVSTNRQRVRIPETPVYLDALLTDQSLAGGLEPRLGHSHLRTLTITGFPTATWPGLLDELNRLAFAYRWSTRAISVGAFEDAMKVQAGIVSNMGGTRTSISTIVGASQSATGALQAAQAGNQLLAIQSQQISDLAAVMSAQGRAEMLGAARAAAAEAEGRERFRRFRKGN